jgi:16S rRNA U1498 N3-methylase RsmE
MAVRLGLLENVQILLGAGAKMNMKDKSDLTVINYLANPRLEKMLQRLMEMGKDEYVWNIILERCVVRLRDPEDMRKVASALFESHN